VIVEVTAQIAALQALVQKIKGHLRQQLSLGGVEGMMMRARG